MIDSHEPTDEEVASLLALGTTLAGEVEELIRWLVRRLWLMRSIILMNVVVSAWNAAGLATSQLPALAVFGCAISAAGALHAIRTEGRLHTDIKEARAHLLEVRTKIKKLTG